jgi:hypothetical protein
MSIEELREKYLTRTDLAELFKARGYPISLNYLNFLCSPAQDQGPPVAGRWGSRPLYTADAALAWAESRMRRSAQQLVQGAHA